MALSSLAVPDWVEKICEMHISFISWKSPLWDWVLWPFDLSEVLAKGCTATHSASSLCHIFHSHWLLAPFATWRGGVFSKQFSPSSFLCHGFPLSLSLSFASLTFYSKHQGETKQHWQHWMKIFCCTTRLIPYLHTLYLKLIINRWLIFYKFCFPHNFRRQFLNF